MDGTVKTLRDTIIEKMKMKYSLMRSSMEFIQTESEFMSEMATNNFGMMAYTVERIKMKMKYNLMRSSMEFIQTESEFMSEMATNNFGMMAFTVERIKTEVAIIEKYQQEVENLRIQLQTLEMLGNTEEDEENEEREGVV